MIICFNATGEAKKALDELMATTQFRDISQVISMALENYRVLQLTIPPGGKVMAAPSVGRVENGTTRVPSNSLFQSTTSAVLPLQYPPLFSMKTASTEGLELPSPHKTTANLVNVPPAQWLFGQYNKFLPVKATCRALLNLQREQPSGISVEDAASKIAHAACGLAEFLKALDAQRHLRREDALAAAFPSSDVNGGGSRLRFGNQFVATIRQGQLGGFPAALRLVTINSSKEPRVSLTKAGGDFAVLANPVLDGNGHGALRKFSDTEVKFLLGHISQSVPEEVSAYVAIIDAIAKGANAPDAIDKFLCRKFNLQVSVNAESDNQITQTFLATQRTGAISRMVDLGLLTREKFGLRVIYAITQNGETFRNQAH
jgi:hypothetical protein